MISSHSPTRLFSWFLSGFFLVVLLSDSAIAGGKGIVVRASRPVPNRYIVTLDPDFPATRNSARDFAATFEARAGYVFKNFGNSFVIDATADQAARISRDPRVSHVEEDAYGEITADQPLSDPHWGRHRVNQRGLLGTVPRDGSTISTGAGVTVFVIDTGVWPQHSEFMSNGTSRVQLGINLSEDGTGSTIVEYDGTYYPAGDRPMGPEVPCDTGTGCFAYLGENASHGTSVASIIAGNTLGIVAEASIVPVKVFRSSNASGGASIFAQGVDWILSACGGNKEAACTQLLPAIANFSGYYAYKSGTDTRPIVDEAAKALVNHNIALVAASGNFRDQVVNGEDRSGDAITPARVPDVITVGGTTEEDALWVCDSSTEGCPSDTLGSNVEGVDIFAPARHIGSADLSSDNLPWSNKRSSETAAPPAHLDAAAVRTSETASGTSFAAPIVTGIAATYLANHPNASPRTLRQFLLAQATPAVVSGIPSPNLFAFGKFRPLTGVFQSAGSATLYGGSLDDVTLTVGGVPVTPTAASSSQLTFAIPAAANQPGSLHEIEVRATPGSALPDGKLTRSLLVDFSDIAVTAIADAPDFIRTLAKTRITQGCGDGKFCPAAPVSRGEMAAFLLRAEHGGAFAPSATRQIFADVPVTHHFAGYIERLFDEKITTGCGTTDPISGLPNYCPDLSVPRDQMAMFLVRTLYAPSYVRPAASGVFADVPITAFAAREIEMINRLGITRGCGTDASGNTMYCPTTTVTRENMAVFLVKAFHLQCVLDERCAEPGFSLSPETVQRLPY